MRQCFNLKQFLPRGANTRKFVHVILKALMMPILC